jgi:hypothetical protein
MRSAVEVATFWEEGGAGGGGSHTRAKRICTLLRVCAKGEDRKQTTTQKMKTLSTPTKKKLKIIRHKEECNTTKALSLEVVI